MVDKCDINGDSILDPQDAIIDQGKKLAHKSVCDVVVAKMRHPQQV